jgi:hypothetical protein
MIVEGRAEEGESSLRQFPISVKAKRFSSSSVKTPTLANARKVRWSALASQFAFSASSNAVCGPEANCSAIPSFATPYMACDTQ